MFGVIATWEMAKDGVQIASNMLQSGGAVMDALEACVNNVEANPEYTSVGYGGLPNEDGLLEMDAAFMDGDTLSIGAVASIKDYLHPCSIARSLMARKFNNFLVGAGAEVYARKHGFIHQDMLTASSKELWQTRRDEVSEEGLNPYIGHDTICAVGLGQSGSMATRTSTSGLFYKMQGRVGDSPLPGCGYYVDSEIGGACATGLGEDLMKGSISYEIVRLMGAGMTAQKACEKATMNLHDSLTRRRGNAGDISVIAMNKKGQYGAAGNIASFPFVVGDEHGVKIYVANNDSGLITVSEK